MYIIFYGRGTLFIQSLYSFSSGPYFKPFIFTNQNEIANKISDIAKILWR